MINKDSIIQTLKIELPFLKEKYGVINIGIFGSYAEETFNESSDIDLYVEFEKPLGFSFFEFYDHLEKLLGKRIDIITSVGLKSIRHESVKKNIERTTVYV